MVHTSYKDTTMPRESSMFSQKLQIAKLRRLSLAVSGTQSYSLG